MENNLFSVPRVGIGVMIIKDNKVLLGKRKNAHGAGEYSFPGGHLEYMESIENCARRETREETGIEIKNVRFQFLANLKDYTPKHYVHIGIVADWQSGRPQIMEPDKNEGWEWYELDKLPEPLFKYVKNAVEYYLNNKENKNFLDS